MISQKISLQVHYIPVVSHPYYQELGYNIQQYPMTEAYYQSTLSIPLYYGLSDADQRIVVSAIKKLLEK